MGLESYNMGCMKIACTFSDVKPYPRGLLILQQPEGFEDEFLRRWGTAAYRTHADCYEALEEVYEAYFGQRRYADFNSFKCARKNRMRTARHAKGY